MNITGRVKLGQLLIRRKVSPGSTKSLVPTGDEVMHLSGNSLFFCERKDLPLNLRYQVYFYL